MSWKQCEPGGLQTYPAQRALPDFPSYPVPNDPQGSHEAREAERRLVAAGWGWPSQLACDADRFGLRSSDFGDRLCGVAVGYLRDCGERGRIPALANAEAVLTKFAVPRDPGALASIIDGTVSPHGSEFADLISDVLRGSEQRSAQQLREITRDSLRAVNHTFNCPRCIACANGSAWNGTRHGAVWEAPAAGKAVRCA